MANLYRNASGVLLLLSLFLCVPSLFADDSFVIKSGDAQINVELSGDDAAALKLEITDWIQTAAKAVSTYYGRFPVPTVTIRVRIRSGTGIHHGVTHAGRRIDIVAGRETTHDGFRADWVMTHEMLHLALPDVGDSNWMGEGLSDYVEPIARAQIGVWPVERVWKDFVEGFPKGLPEPGDQGLDGTHSWGRTYWGGALFWFLADVQIREETHNKHSLRDALRAILNAGGDGRADWPPDHVFETGDNATGTHVLQNLHAEMGSKPVTPNLNALWKRLGVIYGDSGQVTFDDNAPLASIRKSMTAPHSSSHP